MNPKEMDDFIRLMNEIDREEDDTVYLINLEDCDGDAITIHEPPAFGGDLMLRVQNDDHICGVIIDGPMAMAIIGVLLPFARQFKLEKYMDVGEADEAQT